MSSLRAIILGILFHQDLSLQSGPVSQLLKFQVVQSGELFLQTGRATKRQLQLLMRLVVFINALCELIVCMCMRFPDPAETEFVAMLFLGKCCQDLLIYCHVLVRKRPDHSDTHLFVIGALQVGLQRC